MNKIWVWVIIVIVVGGAAFWGGMTYAQNSAASARSSFAGRTGAGAAGFAGRTTAAGATGGATFGTILSTGNGSITIQLPSSTSTTASTGTKIVLYDSSTQVQELQTVPTSNLTVGQSVTVTGTANSDGSVTAQSIQIRPAGARGFGAATPTTSTGQ